MRCWSCITTARLSCRRRDIWGPAALRGLPDRRHQLRARLQRGRRGVRAQLRRRHRGAALPHLRPCRCATAWPHDDLYEIYKSLAGDHVATMPGCCCRTIGTEWFSNLHSMLGWQLQPTLPMSCRRRKNLTSPSCGAGTVVQHSQGEKRTLDSQAHKCEVPPATLAGRTVSPLTALLGTARARLAREPWKEECTHGVLMAALIQSAPCRARCLRNTGPTVLDSGQRMLPGVCSYNHTTPSKAALTQLAQRRARCSRTTGRTWTAGSACWATRPARAGSPAAGTATARACASTRPWGRFAWSTRGTRPACAASTWALARTAEAERPPPCSFVGA